MMRRRYYCGCSSTTTKRDQRIVFLLSALLTFLSITTITKLHVQAWIFPLPPWRGPRQLLAVGPWGDLLDIRKSKEVLWIEQQTQQNDNNDNNNTNTNNTPTAATTRLIHSSQLPKCPPNHRRIVATSDTHGKHRFVHIPECDVFLHCGDILQRYGYVGDLGGGIPVLLDFASWVGGRHVKAKHVVVIAGNHDRLLEKIGPQQIQSILTNKVNSKNKKGKNTKYSNNNKKTCHYLQNGAVKVADLVVYGSPWSPKGTTGNRAFQHGENASNAVGMALRGISTLAGGDHHDNKDDNNSDVDTAAMNVLPDVDILMTHASCREWEPFVRNANVQLWLHGHWHDGQGNLRTLRHDNDDEKSSSSPPSSSSLSINVASNDMIYRPRNPPVVMDVPIRPKKG